MKSFLPVIIFFLFLSIAYTQEKSNSYGSTSDTTIHIDKKVRLDAVDGPYIVNDTLYRVDLKNRLIIEDDFFRDSILVCVDNNSGDSFYFSLESDYVVPQSTYDLPEKIIAISDIEGKFSAFTSFLIAHKVMDENYNWIFNDGHLVLVGDFVDRGKNVAPVLWLIYKLEFQARNAGGQVHFILGNHEILNFHGDYRYNRGKYIKVAQEISGSLNKKKAIKYMYSERSELGKWLATKNVIEKIGDYVFVHAGLSPETLNYKLNLHEINANVRLGFNEEMLKKDKTINFLYGSKGPFWYRGLVMNRTNYNKVKAVALDSILTFYDSKNIIIGHTVVKDITTGYDGKVMMIDVVHGHAKFSGKTKGLLIENGSEYAIDDLGNKTEIKKQL